MRKPALPPLYFWGAVAAMIAMHFLIPLPWKCPSFLFWPGVILLVLGSAINIWTSERFKKARTTIKPFEKPDAFIVDGCFRFSRNPVYLGMVLILIGLWFVLRSGLTVLVIPVFIGLIRRRFILPEEAAMEERFGEAYREYRRKVRRWI